MNIDFTLAAGVIITGLVVVFLALIGLSVIVWLVGKLFVAASGAKKPDKPQAAPQSNPTPPATQAPLRAQANSPEVEDGISDEIVAVIAAAVAAMGSNGAGFVLRSVRRVREGRSAWAQAGLLQNTQPF